MFSAHLHLFPARVRPRRHAAGLLAVALLLGACDAAKPSRDAASADSAVTATDDAGREIRLARPAARIVSLVPSATETLVAIGARGVVVGRTDYDEAPEVAAVPSVGGGLDPSLERLAELRPDLVIGWETVGHPELRDRLEALGIPVFAMATQDTADVFRGIASLGRLTGRAKAADSLAASVRAELDAVRASVAGKPRPSVFWLVQTDPPMTAGRATFVSELLEVAGGRNAFGDLESLWPSVAMEEIVRRQPDVLLVPVVEAKTARVDELRALPGWRELRAMREGRARAVDAALVNRPGPSIGRAARAVAEAIHAPASPR